MMGMRRSSFVLSWFITYACIMFVTVIIVTLIVTLGPVLPQANYLVIFLLIFFYCLSTIAFAFLLSPLFKNPKVAGGVGSFLWSLLAVLYIPLNGLATPASAGAKWFVVIMSLCIF